jgi:integrase
MEAGRRRFKSGFTNRDDAEKVLDKIKGEIAVGRAGLPPDPRGVPTLAVLAKPWLERRKATHAAGAEDACRWERHLAHAFGKLRPDEVDTARIRAFVEANRRDQRQPVGERAPRDGKLAPGTLRVVIAVLSSLYEDLLERGIASRNPARHLPKSLQHLVRSDHDPATTPFVERREDVRRIFLALRSPLNVAYAIGALGGLRTGEVFALRWSSVDLATRRLFVSESVGGRTKDRDPRAVPIQDALLPVLKAWQVESGGKGLVIPPLRKDGGHVDKATPAEHLRAVLVELGLKPLEPKVWYQATRHTFASHWVMAGGSLRELQAILGHASITETERYAHLAPGYFSEGAHSTISIDLRPGGAVVPLTAEGTGSADPVSIGHSSGTHPGVRRGVAGNHKRNAGAAL